MKGTLLVKNVKHLVTCDANDRLLDGVDVFIRDGVIEQSARWKKQQRM